jgi:hypothetical protein
MDIIDLSDVDTYDEDSFLMDSQGCENNINAAEAAHAENN